MRKLVKNTIIYGLGSVSSKLIGVVLLPILTYKLTPENFGVIGILTMFSLFLNAIISLGFGTSIGICYFEKKSKEERVKVILTAFYTLFFFSLFVVFICFLLNEKINSLLLGDSVKDVYIFNLTLLSTLFMTVVMPFMFNLQFQEKAKEFVICSLLTALTSLFLNIYLVVVIERGLTGYFEAYLFTQIFALLIFGIFNKVHIKIEFDPQYFRELLRLGLPMIPSFFSLFVLNQSNRYLLKIISGLEAVGIFTVGFNIGSAMQLFIGAFQNAWTPYFLSFIDKQSQAVRHFGEIFKFFCIGVGFLVLCFFIFSKPVTMIFINKNFINAYKVIGLVALANFFIAVYGLLLPPMYFSKEVKFSSIIQGIVAIISLTVNYIMIYFFSYFGAGIGYAASYSLICLFTFFYNKYLSKCVLKTYESDGSVKKIFVFFATIMFITMLERDFDVIEEFTLSFGIFFFALGITLKYFLKEEERKKFKNMIFSFGFLRG